MTSSGLNKRITLLTPSITQDAAGGLEAAVAGTTVWGAIDDTGSLFQYQTQFVDISIHLVTIRYRDGVAAGMQVQFGTRIFNVVDVKNPKQANVWLDLICQEIL